MCWEGEKHGCVYWDTLKANTERDLRRTLAILCRPDQIVSTVFSTQHKNYQDYAYKQRGHGVTAPALWQNISATSRLSCGYSCSNGNYWCGGTNVPSYGSPWNSLEHNVRTYLSRITRRRYTQHKVQILPDYKAGTSAISNTESNCTKNTRTSARYHTALAYADAHGRKDTLYPLDLLTLFFSWCIIIVHWVWCNKVQKPRPCSALLPRRSNTSVSSGIVTS